MKSIQSICTAFLVALLTAFCGISARAQYEDGSLIGSIHDATGAAVGNAAVTVTNVNTGIAIKIAGGGSGDYELPSLRVGVYNIEASALFCAGRAGRLPKSSRVAKQRQLRLSRLSIPMHTGSAVDLQIATHQEAQCEDPTPNRISTSSALDSQTY
jgi:hypothetical protein